MMRILRSSLLIAVLGIPTFAWAGNPGAPQIPIVGYDINDAFLSGFGNFTHTYTGTIAAGDGFTHFGIDGTQATYSGVGSGTLNDGIISSSGVGTQLFQLVANLSAFDPDTDPSNDVFFTPTIFLTLSELNLIETIEIFGGDLTDNAIPGQITGVTVTLLNTNGLQSHTFATTPFGILNSLDVPVNDGISLIGSPLEGVPAFAVFLSDFTGDFADASDFGPSITEIKLFGNPVPEPSTAGLFLLAATFWFWRKRRVGGMGTITA